LAKYSITLLLVSTLVVGGFQLARLRRSRQAPKATNTRTEGHREGINPEHVGEKRIENQPTPEHHLVTYEEAISKYTLRRIPPTQLQVAHDQDDAWLTEPAVDIVPDLVRLPPPNEWQIEVAAPLIDEPHRFAHVLGEFNRAVRPRLDYPLGVAGDMQNDFVNYYSRQNLAILAISVAGAAAIANSGWDENLRITLHDNLVYTPSDEYVKFFRNHKFMGDGWFLLPAYAGVAVIGKGIGDEPLMPVFGEWGERSFRGILVGAPPLLLMQWITGGSRPEENNTSHWHPFEDDNGVSGHAFMGAIPWLSAAKMTDRPLLKTFFYAGSLLPGMSRITDDAHFPSQVFLGWVIAYVATTAVDQTQESKLNLTVFPWQAGDAAGIAVERSW